jgi:iron complex outermembrane receptor protein
MDLSVATIEDLMNIEITSASRKEQRAEEVAAPYVITHDIRRSGMTSVPDLLRLVPAQWQHIRTSGPVRGFNGLY